ncbi:unnamed protein product [Malus baccata var. baccata]
MLVLNGFVTLGCRPARVYPGMWGYRGAINLGSTTINVAEALALLPRNLRSIIEDIRWCASSFQDIKWGHAFEEANFVVDVVASVELK